MKRILVATDFSVRSHRAVRRAGLLARKAGAELTLLHVVDEDQPAHLVALEQTEGRKILEEQIEAVAELRGLQCRALIATGVVHDAIIRTAGTVSADVIVMGTHRKQVLRDIFVGTTIERVIRTGNWPVLMVNADVGDPYANVLAAVDLSDASADAVRAARSLGFLDQVSLTVVHAFDAAAKPKMVLADVEEDRIGAYVEQERQRATTELQTFMTSLSIDNATWSPYVAEGEAMSVISRAVESIQPDLLIIGTHGRSAVAKLLLGSVAEQVLRVLTTDVLAVPRPASSA